MSVFYARTFLLFAVGLCVGSGAMGLYLAIRVLSGGSVGDIILGALGVGMSAIAGRTYVQQLREPRPLLILSAEGVTNKDGRSFDWRRVSKIHWFLGSLRLCDDSKPTCLIAQLDHAEVGGGQLKSVVEFVKAHAPSHLTERL